LGLLANTELFGFIWSLGLGAFFALQNRRDWRSLVPGAVIYATLGAFSLAIMVPTPDYYFLPSTPRLMFNQLNAPLLFVLNAFFPFFYPFTDDAMRAIGVSPQLAPKLALLIGQSNPLLAVIALGLPILACWSIVRDAKRTAQYTAIFI